MWTTIWNEVQSRGSLKEQALLLSEIWRALSNLDEYTISQYIYNNQDTYSMCLSLDRFQVPAPFMFLR
jgi:hypothetical protein